MKYFLLLLSFGILSLNIACSDDDDDGNSSACSQDNFSATSTGVTESLAGGVIISVDVTNDSSTDYDVSGTVDVSDLVHANVVVTTTDGSEYETRQAFSFFTLSAGATSSQLVSATFGADKEYASHTITLSCG